MEPIIGIDLGTTNSEVAVVENGKARVLLEDGQAILPSVVGLDEAGRLLVGAPARNQFVLAPERTVRSIKRKMGEAVAVKLGDQELSPQEISAMILRTLKQRAERELGRPVSKAVITVPAFFNEIQREATREAGELAGLEVLRIINEPTAASLTYEPHPTDMEHLLVYDLGGGTFDVSIVQIEQGVVEVLASHGDTHLGGDDFDELLLNYICDEFAAEHGIDLRQSLVAKSRLLRAAEDAKKALSDAPFARIDEEFIAEKDGLPLHLNLELARDEYESLIEPLLSKTLVCIDESLSDAKLQASQIDKIILVGGASRTPLVHRLLTERLNQPLHTEVDPDLAVAMGAAIQGALIAGLDVGPVLVDITPHTLGIQALGPLRGMMSINAFSPIIERNTALPARRSQVYITSVDGQEAALISVYQGENEDIRYNQKVGEFLLEGLADVEHGNEIIVRFDLDLDGILKVTAVERTTGLEKRLVIDNAVERFRMLNRDAAQARLDTAFGIAAAGSAAAPASEPEDAGLPVELRQLIARAEDYLVKGRDVLATATAEDAQDLQRVMGELRTAITARSEKAIRKALAELEDIVFYLQDT
jgi:molecular chaperone DnaK